jgi:hypothetical protein
MKNLALLLVMLVLAIAAIAQQNINFADLPDVSSPTPLPADYQSLNWSCMFYVNPAEWSGSGPGFGHQNNIAGTDVAFGPGLCAGPGGASSISSVDGKGFLLLGATAAGGYSNMSLTVMAYNHGSYVGSYTYQLSTNAEVLIFPPKWGYITQAVFQGSGTLVLYNVQVYNNQTRATGQ